MNHTTLALVATLALSATLIGAINLIPMQTQAKITQLRNYAQTPDTEINTNNQGYAAPQGTTGPGASNIDTNNIPQGIIGSAGLGVGSIGSQGIIGPSGGNASSQGITGPLGIGPQNLQDSTALVKELMDGFLMRQR